MSGYQPNQAYGLPYAKSGPSMYDSNATGGQYQGSSAMMDYNQAQTMAAFYQNPGIPGLGGTSTVSNSTTFGTQHGWPAQATSASHVGKASNEGIISDYTPVIGLLHNGESTPRTNLEEQGVLSDGEFEPQPPTDLTHRPSYPNTGHRDTHKRDSRTPRQNKGNPGTANSFLPLQNRPFVDVYGRTVDASRQRSPSYSPHISPVLAPRQPPRGPANRKHSGRQRKAVPTPMELDYDEGEVSEKPNLQDSHNDATLSKLSEARKEAQSAILNLWPFKIRMEDYIEEGIDEDIVQSQFAALGMQTSIVSLEKKSSPEQDTSQLTQSTALKKMQGSAPTKAEMTMQTQSSKSNGNNKAEERKDRIARLLAEKAKKASDQDAAAAVAASAAASAKAEKERLLRQKMEALTKSREARAKPQIAKPKSPSLQQPIDMVHLSAPITESATTTSHPSSLVTTSLNSPAQSPTLPVAPHASSIPGLFLASGRSFPSPPSMAHVPLGSMHRKRPVASDFDSSTPIVKRPFGENRHDQRLVIDVSEEDSDDGGGDGGDGSGYNLSDTGDNEQNHPTLPTTSMGASIRDYPPLSDLQSRKFQHAPQSGLSTPPTPQVATRSPVVKPQDLKTQEQEIQDLKKRILLAELRKKAKKSLAASKGVGLMQAAAVGKELESETSAIVADKVEATARIEHLIDVTTHQINNDQQSLADAMAAGAQKMRDLNASEAEERRLRRLKIRADLPIVEAEVEESRKRLAQLKEEMANLEAAVEEGLKNKLRLAQEMEKLQEDGFITPADLDAIEKQPMETSSVETETAISTSASNDIFLHDINGALGAPNTSSLHAETAEYAAAHTDVSAPKHFASLPLATDSVPNSSQDKQSDDSNIEKSVQQTVEHERALDADLQKAIANAAAESIGSVSDDVDMEDSFAPDPKELDPVSPTGVIADEAVTANSDNATLIPAEHLVAGLDECQPPDDSVSIDMDDVPMSVDSPPSSPAQREETEDVEDNAQRSREFEDSPENEIALAVHDGDSGHHNAKPAEVIQKAAGTQMRLTFGQNPAALQKGQFTPYESPLKRFRAFRFHPNYETEVSGGFNSLTYSNKINPEQEFCRYELAGGICNDHDCEFQHFRDILVADDAILVQLGNAEGYSEEDRPKFVVGLKNVLTGLRAQRVRDFRTIAAHIAAYRAEFLKDSSRVLTLDGVTV